MRQADSGVEMLLLLCCLVGVVAFVSFGLGASNALVTMAADERQPGSRLEGVLDQQEARRRMAELEEEKWRLEEQYRGSPTHPTAPGSEDDRDELELRAEIARLEAEATDTRQRIDRLRADIARLERGSGAEGSEQREAELARLRAKLEELERQKRAAEATLAARQADAQRPRGEGLALEERLHSLREQEERLTAELNECRTRLVTAGTGQFKNPIYFECVEDGYTLYPEGRRLRKQELEQGALLEELTAGHDVVVVYVRPTGYDTHELLSQRLHDLESVKQDRVMVSYEPVKPELDLAFLKGASQ